MSLQRGASLGLGLNYLAIETMASPTELKEKVFSLTLGGLVSPICLLAAQ